MAIFRFLHRRGYSARLEPSGENLALQPRQKLLDAALEAGLAWPHDCRVGSCGSCRCVLKRGAIRRLTDFAYTLSAEDIHAGAILACQSLLKSDVVVEVALDDVITTRTSGIIRAARYLTPDIQELVVATDAPGFGHARAGQHAELSHGTLAAPRCYSFARAPALEAPGVVRFYIRHVPGGAFTDWLFAADRTGASVAIAGPFGRFGRGHHAATMICVAGGSGLAPIIAILQETLEAGPNCDVRLYFGARARRDLYCQDELGQLAHRWPGRFVVVPVLSQEPAGSAWEGLRGLVTEQLAHDLTADGPAGAAAAYVCGPPPMVDAAVAVLRTTGVADGAIAYDKFLDARHQPR